MDYRKFRTGNADSLAQDCFESLGSIGVINRVSYLLSIFIFIISFAFVAQAQDRFPQRTDTEINQRVQDTINRLKRDSSVGREVGDRIRRAGSGGELPPHPWKCGNPNTERDWKFDSNTIVTGNLNFQSTFASCFQAIPKQDVGLPGITCMPIPMPVIGTLFDICWDPGIVGSSLGKDCCPQNRDLLELCGIPKNKSNRGYNLTYWWPENQAEIHNYETAAFDPTYECGNEAYRHAPLIDFLRNLVAATTGVTSDQAGIPASLRDPTKVNIGQSHAYGSLPGDQTFRAEAHVYRSYLATLTSLNNDGNNIGKLGYKRNCGCFYALTQRQRNRKVVNGWTELPRYLPYWRTYQLSSRLSAGKFEPLKQFRDPMTDTCASYRAYHPTWGKPISAGGMGYGDLISSVGIGRPRNIEDLDFDSLLKRICYQGGGDLFPITGELIGPFSQLPATAYLARRAFYLFGKDRITGDDWGSPKFQTEATFRAPPALNTNYFVPDERRINKYSDRDDKMQRIYPLKDDYQPSACFRGHQIPNYAQEGTPSWPKGIFGDALKDGPGGPKDAARYVYWNKRSGCMCPYIGPVAGLKWHGTNKFINCWQTDDACRQEDEGDKEDQDTDPLGGNRANTFPLPIPDGIPYPFLPTTEKASYGLDPLKGSDPAFPQSWGGQGEVCELQKGDAKINKRLPEELYVDEAKGGIKCNPNRTSPRCDQIASPPVVPTSVPGACVAGEVSCDGQCYAACTGGTSRRSGSCDRCGCAAVSSTGRLQEEWNGQCLDFCAPGQIRNSSGTCICPPPTELCVNGEEELCRSACLTNKVRNHIGTSATPPPYTPIYGDRSPCECVCPRALPEECNGSCWELCEASHVRNSSCQCVCPDSAPIECGGSCHRECGTNYRFDTTLCQCVYVPPPASSSSSAGVPLSSEDISSSQDVSSFSDESEVASPSEDPSLPTDP